MLSIAMGIEVGLTGVYGLQRSYGVRLVAVCAVLRGYGLSWDLGFSNGLC